MANKQDFATGTVLTAPSPASSGTSLTLQTGEGARMPAVPFFAVAAPDGVLPTLDNAEKIQVTAVAGDTLTIVRAQGSTTAKNIATTWRISNSVFAQDIDDKIDSNAILQGLAGLSTAAGAVFQTGTSSFAKRSFQAGSSKITITNGNGVSGNPSIDLGTVTKSDVGLANVDNTSDANKPVSTATTTALAGKVNLWNGGIDATPLIVSPESSHAAPIPYYANDIAYNRLRGGATRVYHDGVLQAGTDANTDKLYEPTSDAFNVNISTVTTIVIEVDFCASFSYGTKVGYAVNEVWRALNVQVEVYTPATTTWTTLANVTGVAYGEKYWAHGGSANPITKARFTFSGWAGSAFNSFRLGQIYVLNYASQLGAAPFMTRNGGTVYGTQIMSGSSTQITFPNSSSNTSGLLYGGDTNLFRSAANTLKTDDNFIVGAPGTASGSAVTVDGTQTLTNKSIPEVVVPYSASTPATPSAGTGKFFTEFAGQSRPRFLNSSGNVEKIQTDADTKLLGYAEITASAALNTTLTDISGLSIAVTVPPMIGSSYPWVKITAFFPQVYGSSRGNLCIREGTTILQSGYMRIDGDGNSTMVSKIFQPTAGAHTYKVSASVTSGTGTIYSDTTTAQAFILAEII